MKKITILSVFFLVTTFLRAQTPGDCVAPMDLNTWQQEGDLNNGNWSVSTDGRSLTQSTNGSPTFFVSPDDYINTTVEGEFGVQTSSDDDYIGFVLGYHSPNSSTAVNNYEMILFDWKQLDQTYSGCFASSGMRLRKISGVSNDIIGTFWCSYDPASTVLATNTDFGGWQDYTYYSFKAEYTETNIKIWIDNVLVFDVNGQFSSGKFGFYNYSQAQSVYRDFAIPFKTFIEKTDSSCPNLAEGTAEAIPSTTDLGPYTYQWSNGVTTKVATDLTPGTYTVDVYGADGCHSSESVTIDSPPDTTPPQAVTNDITVELDVFGNAAITPEDIDNGSSDNCGIETMTLSQSNFTTADLGPRTVTLTVTDYDGNTDAQTAIVTVVIIDTSSFITTWKTDNPGSSCNSCITIPTTGTGYNYDVDWNDDGIFDEFGITGTITHDFGTPGTYTIRIKGDFPQMYFNNSGDKEKILSVDQWGSISWSSMERSFFGCANLILNSQDAPDLSNATSLALMFAYASSFNQSINMWNVSNITNMYGTFVYASSYNQPLNSWNTQNVTRMDDMFYGASSFNQPLNMWNTGNVRTMEGMFTDASTFNQDIGTWNISNVNSTETMFSGALSFNQNIGAWDVGNVTNMNRMFQNAISFNQDIGAWEVSNVLSMEGMFLQAYSFNQNIGNWNVSNVNSMAYMFTGARIFNQDIGNWDVSNVKNMRSMFQSANAFHQNIEYWIVGNVSDMTDMFRFASIRKENYDRLLINWGNQTLQSNVHFHAGNSQYCEGAAARQQLIDDFGWTITDEGPAGELLTLDQENLPDIIESSSVTSLPAPTATNCVGETITATTTTSFPITAPGETIVIWTYEVPDGTTIEQQQKVIIEDTTSFITTWKTDNPGTSCNSCITIPTPTDPGYNYNVDWNNDGIFDEFNLTGSITHDFGVPGIYTIRINGDFPRIYFAASGDQQKIISVDQWGETIWRTMNGAFVGCKNLSVNANDVPDLSIVTDMSVMFLSSGINQNINDWDVSNVTDMNSMFTQARSFNQPLDKWNVSNVTNMRSMFQGAYAFNQDIGTWDVSHVIDMSYMFLSATAFNNDLGNWNVGQVNNMYGMFKDAISFNQNIGNWDVSQVMNMELMFRGASSFNQNIGNWNVSHVLRMDEMFYGANTFNQNISSWNVSQVKRMGHMFSYATAFNQDIGSWNVSQVETTGGMFAYAISFNQDIGNWDVSKVINMNRMFHSATNFNQNIGNWDVSNVTNMANMFHSASSFNQNIGGWDVSQVSFMNSMFDGVNLSTENYDNLLIGWGIRNLKPNVYFHGGTSKYCEGATARQQIIDDFNWTITDAGPAGELLTLDQEILPDIIQSSSVISLPAPTATNCVGETVTATTTTSFPITTPGETIITWIYEVPDGTTLDQQQLVIIEDNSSFITTWKTDNTGTSCNSCITIPTIGVGYNFDVDWNDDGIFDQLGVTSSIVHDFGSPGTYTIRIRGDFPRIFFNNTGDKEKILSVDQWGNILWTSMVNAFYGCSNLNIPAQDAPDLSNVTDMRGGFAFCKNLNQDIGHWDVSNVTSMPLLFAGAESFNQDIGGWNVSNVIDMSNLFSGAKAFNQDIGSWNVSRVTNMSWMFYSAHTFNQGIGNWDVSQVTNMSSMFRRAFAFNQDIGNWDVSQVNDMSYMFYDASDFNHDIKSWNVSQVTNMRELFRYASAFNQDIGNWDVSNVINMSGMFHRASAFNQNIENWNVSKVTNMSQMFQEAYAFNQDVGNWDVSQVTTMRLMFTSTAFNHDIGNWDVSQVTDMAAMFRYAISFNQDIGGWNPSQVTNMSYMFDGVTLSINNYDNLLIGWRSKNLQSGVSFDGGNSQYCEGAAARQHMIDNDGWTITDGGPAGDLLTLDQETLPDINESCQVLSIPAPSAVDCSGETITATTTTVFPITQQGETIVTWIYDDGNGNTAEQQQKVIIEDVTPPVVVTKNITVQLDATGNVSIAEDAVNDGSSDACGGLSFDTDITDFTCSDVGENPVMLSVTDGNGQTASAPATVTVQDITPPSVITKNITVQLDATGNVSIAEDAVDDGSSDACGGLTFDTDITGFDCSNVGANTVVLTVTDANGNFDSAGALVTVEDNVKPVVITKNITVQLDALGIATIAEDAVNDGSSDACGGLTFDTDITSFDCSDVGTNTVVLTVTDANGNFDSAGATVTVEDNVKPVVVTKNITVQLDALGSVTIAEDAVNDGSSDACGGLTFDTDITSFDCSDVGANTVVLTVTDANGNFDSAGATVTVEDNVKPVVVTKNITVQLDALGSATIAEDAVNDGSSDACGGLTFDTDITSFDCSAVGANTVVLTVTDANGNFDSAGATVTVEDNVKPVVVTKNITVQLDATGNVSIAEDAVDDGSSDACGGLTFDTDITSFDCSNVGANTVVLTVTDVNGNFDSAGATVTVEDNVKPVVVTKNITVQLDALGSATIAEDAVNDGSSDACGGLSFDTDITSFDCSNVGGNTVVLTVTDANGNFDTAQATVTVEDNVDPLAIVKNISIDLDNTGNATIEASDVDDGSSDNCSITNYSLSQTSFDCSHIGTNNVTLTVTDIGGNMNSKIAVVTVNKFKPETTVAITSGSKQYSDEITLTATIKYGYCSSARQAANKVSFYIGTQKMGTANLTVNGNDLVGSLTTPLVETPTHPSNAQLSPGLPEVTAVFEEINTDSYELAQPTADLIILKENAIVEYVGQELQATSSATSSSTTVMLMVNVQDNSISDGNDDYPGDIRNAKVKFVNKDNNSDISGWLSVENLIDPADKRTGSVTYPWNVNIVNADSESFTVGIIVDGYYSRSSSEDNTVITVYKPSGDFITGGGYIRPDNSAGTYASTEDLKTNFGFNVKYNKKGNQLKGHMNVVFRRLEADGVHTYQVKGNAIQSLGVNIADENHKTAEFITKSNLTDITDPYYPVSLGGNMILKVNMIDKGEPGSLDQMAITLTNNNSLIYSSNWNGLSTDEMLLGGGNLVVHSGFSLNKNTTATEDISITTFSEENDVTKPLLDMTIAPNPSSTYFSVRIHTENKKDNVLLVVHSYLGSILYKTEGKPDKEFTFGSGFAAGTYIVKIYQANLSAQKIVIKE